MAFISQTFDLSDSESDVDSSINLFLAPKPPVVPPKAENDTEFYEKFYFTFTYTNTAALVGLVLFIIWVIGINSSIIIGIVQCDRKLHSDWYTLNLAVGDILVGILVLPFMCTVVILGYFPFGPSVCSFWIYFDYYLIFAASVGYCCLLFCYIWMINWPKHFEKKDYKFHVKIIVTIWILINVAWTPAFFENRLGTDKDGKGVCGYNIYVDRYTTLYLGIVGLYIPGVCTILGALWCAFSLFRYGRRDRIIFRDIVPFGQEQAPIFMIKVFPLEKEKAHGIDYLDVGMGHLPTVFWLLIAFFSSRLLFYIYFGAGAFVPKLFPPDLSNGVYWLMHSNAGFSPLLHIFLDKQIRDGIFTWLKKKRSSVVHSNEIIL